MARKGIGGIAVVGLILLGLWLWPKSKAEAAPVIPTKPEIPTLGLANLSGMVTDRETGKALFLVEVRLRGADRESVTSTFFNGRYDFSWVSLVPGANYLSFTKSGYQTEEGSILLLLGENVQNATLLPA